MSIMQAKPRDQASVFVEHANTEQADVYSRLVLCNIVMWEAHHNPLKYWYCMVDWSWISFHLQAYC